MMPNITLILGFCIEIAIQTAFLTLALWIMIRLQKLDYNFLGLLGSAALTTVLRQILNLILVPVLGGYLTAYISNPIAVIALLICIAKITQAERVDVVFTVSVGYAVLFCMNLFLLGALMGDLRPDLRSDTDTTQTAPDASMVAATNSAAPKAVTVAPVVKPAEGIAKHLSVKGVVRNGPKSMLMLSDGAQIHTLSLGEKTTVHTPEGTSFVKFDHLETNSVVLVVDGTLVKLPAP